MHPGNVPFLQIAANNISKQLVNGLVSLPVGRFVIDIGVEIMKEGPDDAVAVALVVVVYLLLGQEYRVVVEGCQLSGDVGFFVRIVGVDARPTHPMKIGMRFEGGQSSG
ncbi:MAG: hypothetical protein BWY72_01597 [Bacteroidetes bacterium ADurb.Bin416]|nr:MAG: hypothetical protein BWY72_01597 [Bacteroidetes bacterium ADurb.Bin416]